MNKAKNIWIGYKASKATGPVDIQWINDELKRLGITFGSHSAIQASLKNASMFGTTVNFRYRAKFWF